MQILNEGEYNYVEQSNLNALPTHVNHISLRTCSKQRVCSSPTCSYCHLKLRNERHHHRQRLLTPQRLAGNCRLLRQQQSDFAYTAHALTAKTIQGRLLFH